MSGFPHYYTFSFSISDIEWAIGVWAPQARGGPWQVLVIDGESCQLALVTGQSGKFTICVEARGVLVVNAAGREAGPFPSLRQALWVIAAIPADHATATSYFGDRRVADRRLQPRKPLIGDRRLAGRRVADRQPHRLADTINF